MSIHRRSLACLVLAVGCFAVTPAWAQLSNFLVSPTTLVERAIEARSSSDIARDNLIVGKVNAIMGELGTVKASTEIYEQRLLVTGLFSDKATYDSFEKKVRAVGGVKKLYWHVACMTEAQQKSAKLLDWADVTVLATKARARLVGTAGVADVNFRAVADAFGTVYLLGRARSQEEATKALARARDGQGVRKLVNLVEVRP